MDLLPTPEQEEIVASVRAVLADRHTLGEPPAAPLWAGAIEQGWFALGLEEELGGVGYTLVEEALLFTEIGRACAPGPFLATSLATRVAAQGGATEIVEGILSGERRVALAEPEGDHWRITDHVGAEIVLVLDERITVAALPTELTDQDSLDELVPLAVGAPSGSVLATAPDSDDVRRRATVLVAALLAGIAGATCEQSVGYAKDREQFGQPIGGFQAVKHRCADMAVRADLALSEVRWAAVSVADGRADAELHAASAALVALDAAIANAQVNIQNHGGIGFTWEHTAHRFVTRARMWSHLLGGRPALAARALGAPAQSANDTVEPSG